MITRKRSPDKLKRLIPLIYLLWTGFLLDDCKKTNCQEGVSRSIYEIYHDTEQILYNILEYVHDLVVVKYIPEGTFLHNRARYNFMIDTGYWRPDLWVIDETATTKILKDLREKTMQ